MSLIHSTTRPELSAFDFVAALLAGVTLLVLLATGAIQSET